MWAWQFYLELLNNMPARSIGAIRKEEEEESAFKILMGISNNSSLKLLNNARGFLYIMERRTSNCYLQLYSRRQYNQLADYYYYYYYFHSTALYHCVVLQDWGTT